MEQTSKSREMARLACKALEEKKGEDIRVIDISKISVLSDYFVICNGSNANQVNALVDEVEEVLGKAGYSAMQREGYGLGNWVLLDFNDIIVHIFDKENREFYNLERIWNDGVDVNIEEL